jgi:hypothetical protein
MMKISSWAPLILAGWLSLGVQVLRAEEDMEAGADQANPDPKAGEWRPWMEMGEQLFTSYIVATATQKWNRESDDFIGDAGGIIGVVVKPNKNGEKIKVTLEGNDLMNPSSIDATLPKADTVYYVYPKVSYKYQELLKVRQVVPLDLKFTVKLGAGEPTSQTLTIPVRPINDCPFSINGEDENAGFDMDFMFAAYVNENHPWIDKLLKDALKTGIVNSFDGYQSREPGKVVAQVYAVWHTLSQREVKYSSVTETAGQSDAVFSQTMRFLDECVSNAQANCADGSVLIASILRKIGINPHLVIVPGHMYLAFDLEPSGENFLGLETTAIGVASPGDFEPEEALKAAIPEEFHEEESFRTFCAAVQIGTKDLNENEEKFADEEELRYLTVDVDAARKDGVMPIPYVKDTDKPPEAEE